MKINISSYLKSDWLTSAGLITLSLVPMAAGIFRINDLYSATKITPENARFFAAPWPVLLHIVGAIVFCVLGAFQFSARLRRRNLKWHRMSGRLVVPCGLVVALSGLWMTQFYPHVKASESILLPSHFDGQSLYIMRLVVGSAMALFLCLGVVAIRHRDIPLHRAWMMRGYALGLGAGTQVFTHLPWFLFPNTHSELARTMLMCAGWAINLAVAERLISRERHIRLSIKPTLALTTP
jgi:uncharacterized membrane protein